MKQNHKGKKLVFQGKQLLEKFGQFSEIGEASESESSSIDEDDDVIVSDHEEDVVLPVAIIAKEHVPVTNEDDNDEDDEGDNEMGWEDDVLVFYDDEDDDDGTDMLQGDDLSGYDNDDLNFDFEQSIDFETSNEDLSLFFWWNQWCFKSFNGDRGRC